MLHFHPFDSYLKKLRAATRIQIYKLLYLYTVLPFWHAQHFSDDLIIITIIWIHLCCILCVITKKTLLDRRGGPGFDC